MKIYDNGKYFIKEVSVILGYKNRESVKKYIENNPHLKCQMKFDLQGKKVCRYITGRDFKRLVIAKRGTLEVLENY